MSEIFGLESSAIADWLITRLTNETPAIYTSTLDLTKSIIVIAFGSHEIIPILWHPRASQKFRELIVSC